MSAMFKLLLGGYRLDETVKSLADEGCTSMVIALPWAMIAPHEQQAVKNHSQSLKRLAERGGLSPEEAYNVLTGKPWGTRYVSQAGVHRALNVLIRRWLASQSSMAQSTERNGDE